jgi:tetratricopeptide (TPR) repeat protein
MQQTQAALPAANPAEGDAEPDYAAIFVENVFRSLQATLARVQQDPNPVLAEETRGRALHVTCDLLLALAPKLEQAGYRGEWLPYLVRGLAVSAACNDALAGAELRLHIGHLHRLQSRWAPARELLTASAEAFAAEGERRGQARALNQLAYVAWQQHEYDEAITLAQAALNLLDDADLERAMGLSALGLVAFDRRQWKAAEQYHRMAFHLRREYGDQRRAAWSLQNLGDAMRAQGKYGDAIACFEEAIIMLSRVDDPAHQAIIQLNLGIVYWLQGELIKALEVYAMAESAFRRFGDESNLAKVLTCKGLDYLALQKWKQAEEAFAASSDLFQGLHDTSEYLNALDGLGISYLEQGRYDKALVIFESIFLQLPQIVDTRAYPNLAQVINGQIERAKAGKSRLSNQES